MLRAQKPTLLKLNYPKLPTMWTQLGQKLRMCPYSPHLKNACCGHDLNEWLAGSPACEHLQQVGFAVPLPSTSTSSTAATDAAKTTTAAPA